MNTNKKNESNILGRIKNGGGGCGCGSSQDNKLWERVYEIEVVSNIWERIGLKKILFDVKHMRKQK